MTKEEYDIIIKDTKLAYWKEIGELRNARSKAKEPFELEYEERLIAAKNWLEDVTKDIEAEYTKKAVESRDTHRGIIDNLTMEVFGNLNHEGLMI